MLPLIKLVSSLNIASFYLHFIFRKSIVILGAESKISFDSIQKLSFSMISVALMAYCAVSPRSLPFPEYNGLFLQNLSIVSLSAIAPLVWLVSVYDRKYNNVNAVVRDVVKLFLDHTFFVAEHCICVFSPLPFTRQIGTFHASFTLGYILAFILEIVVTTALRLGVFLIVEPAIFSLAPEVPSIDLPWVLREKQYRPKRITLFAADFATSCVASPIIEEYLKLKVVQWTCRLPR